MKPASEKQIKFANEIANYLHLTLPEEKTAQSYFLFIRDNIYTFKARKRSVDDINNQEEIWFCPLSDTF